MFDGEAEPALDPRRWQALAVVGAAFLMTGLDISIVNVALPTIGRQLHFSPENLQWVVSAYAIAFGGFLLLGGRAADLLGRRAVFAAGVVLFTGASLACGLSGSETALIAFRAVQGAGAAVIAPAALALTPAFVRESRAAVARRRFDPLGALVSSASIALLVYAISKAPDVGWGAARTIVMLVAAVALLGVFLLVEARSHDPLMPLSIWRLRTVTTANALGVVVGAVMFSTFFMLTIYAQQVLHYSPVQTGLAMLATALTAIVAAGAAEALVTRLGPKYVMAAGVAFMCAGLVYFAQIPVEGSYFRDLFGPLVLIGLGTGFGFVPISIVALAGVPEREAGLASGLMNTTQQVGGAVGVAVVATIFATHLSNAVANGVAPPQAMVEGFHLGFWTLAAVALAGCAAVVVLLRGIHLGEPEETHVVSPFCVNRAATSALATVVLGREAAADLPAAASSLPTGSG